LAIPEALVEISMVAIPNGSERRVVHPSDWIRSPNPYSYGILSGDTLFLAGLISRNGKDNSVVTGDIKVQTNTVMKNAGEVLEAAGMTFADVVSSRVYIRKIAEFRDMTSTYRAFFPKDPPARATVRADLMGPQFDIEITLLAVKDAPRRALITPNADGSPGQANPNFSSAIHIGNRLYLAGLVGSTPETRSDIRGQTKETMARIERTMKAAGFGWDHVVDSVVYVTDMKSYGAMNETYSRFFRKDFPARMTAEVGLVGPDALVEIMMTAVK
jgi:2-iminobutanoate/2-iminopropanoate deaminase